MIFFLPLSTLSDSFIYLSFLLMENGHGLNNKANSSTRKSKSKQGRDSSDSTPSPPSSSSSSSHSNDRSTSNQSTHRSRNTDNTNSNSNQPSVAERDRTNKVVEWRPLRYDIQLAFNSRCTEFSGVQRITIQVEKEELKVLYHLISNL